MEQSQFISYIKKFFTALLAGIVAKINGSENEPTYLHMEYLKPELSITGKWESVQYNGVLVTADYVSMDSSLPLKSRASMGKASGDIPKMGIEKQKNEQQITDLQTMQAMNVPETTIVARIFDDVKSVIGGVKERNEASFLQGLSTGVALVPEDDKNQGTGIRLDYKYPTANKFGVPVLWSNTSSTPLSDIQSRILEKASTDGKIVRQVLIDRATFQNIAKTDEAKNLYAASIGNFGPAKPAPSFTKLNDAVQAEYGYTFRIIDRSVTAEKRDGTTVTYKPWAAGAVVALTSEKVGALVYAPVAEANAPVAGVEYQTVENYILVSLFRVNRPSLAEVTNAQARVAPVIGETVYLMDSLTVQA